MKSDCSAESWLRFFTSAGIPSESARTYAVTFSKNEIQLDMLSEIKKEYLVDMGITLMGHIIAILRHAKTVYEENVTKSTLSTPDSKSTNTAVKVVPKEKPVLKTMPLRIANEKEILTVTNIDDKSIVTAPVESRYRAISTSTLPLNIYGPHPKISSAQEQNLVLKISKKKESDNVQKMKMSSIVSNPNVKKKPSEPARRQNDEVTSTKGKVFERLGVEVTDNPSDSPESTSSTEGVFSRLGVKSSPSYSPCNSPAKPTFPSLTNGIESISIPKVKRSAPNGNKQNLKSMICTMRADEAELQNRRGRKRNRSPSPDGNNVGPSEFRFQEIDLLKSNIKARLGNLSKTSPPPRRGMRSISVDRSIGLRNFGEVKPNKTLKSRLGQATVDRTEDRSQVKGSILSKRKTATQSIALSGLGTNTNANGIKSRQVQGNAVLKTSQKKVSFGPVQQQYIPIEVKPASKQFVRYGNRFQNVFDDDYSMDFEQTLDMYDEEDETVNYLPRSRIFNRLGR